MSNENKIKKKNIKKYSEDEVKEKLKEYVRIDDISKVNIGTHIRYFSVVNGKRLFRLGGFLNKINLNDGYIVLGNNKITWSVQIKSSIFFKKMNFDEIKKHISLHYEEKIKKLKEENNKLKKSIKEIRNNKK